jgi:hypothetical protein
MATNKKLAALQLDCGRTIHGFVTIPESDGYLEVQIVKIENPIPGDWVGNDAIKISKELIKNVIWK